MTESSAMGSRFVDHRVRAIGDYLAMFQTHYAVCKLSNQPEIVAGDNDRDADLVEAFKQSKDLDAEFRIEVSSGLVGQ